MYKNIIFDLGGVMVDFDPKTYLVDRFCNAEVEEQVSQLTFESEEWKLLDAGLITRSEANNVDTITVGGVSVRGTELRSILSLRSASFDVEVKNGKLIFYVTGFGHGVGLSQYGANEMAEEGADWLEIVTHYYTGVTVGPYTPAALQDP